MSTTQNTDREKGVSLARGPALIIGTVLLIAGLYFVYAEHGFPRLAQFPNATAHVNGKAFFHIFGLNGWSGELTAAAGGLLLFGAAQHLLAKTASLIVAVILAGVGIWALANHHSALGLFAANIWTILLWFAAAVLLLINALLPRTPGSERRRTADSVPSPTLAPRQPAAADTPPEPVAADTSTMIAERPPVRVRPSGGSLPHDETPAS